MRCDRRVDAPLSIANRPMMIRTVLCSLFCTLALSQASGAVQEPAAANTKVVRVFILAGQSNMEGKAQMKLMDHQAQTDETREFFAHLRDGTGWRVRDDAFIKFFGRHGQLTAGYGSRDRTGVELEFGTIMAERFDEPVLLIKTAWGGRSIDRDFRPPSSGLPSKDALEAELATAIARTTQENEKRNQSKALPTMEEIQGAYGKDYRAMLSEVGATLAGLDTFFPELAGHRPLLTGFVWFQGWNDQYGGAETRYEGHMQNFIGDVRRDLDAPKLPIVIGAMGQNGSKPAKGPMLAIQTAQLAMNDVPDFAGSVRTIRTDVLIDKAAEALYPRWKEEMEQWERTGSDHAYHYLGSAIWFTRIGRAMANEMLLITDD
ncbi:MAG: hypothetical protein ACI80K_002309 [Paracoccaceae bacterium]|jgi:hypothetical protein